jgi:hypothetical protein
VPWSCAQGSPREGGEGTAIFLANPGSMDSLPSRVEWIHFTDALISTYEGLDAILTGDTVVNKVDKKCCPDIPPEEADNKQLNQNYKTEGSKCYGEKQTKKRNENWIWYMETTELLL